MFQHTATRRWLPVQSVINFNKEYVSTHSHPKVAAGAQDDLQPILECFNTQPPEGGCEGEQHALLDSKQFQHTATRRWLPIIGQEYIPTVRFQHTATRRWLPSTECAWCKSLYCFNTQPPEGGCRQGRSIYSKCHWFQHTATRRWLQAQHLAANSVTTVSTHSHPKVAAY